MYEDRPELDTPPRVRAMLRLYGGSTPDGGPLWRLILAQNKRIRAAGVMRTMGQQPADQWHGERLHVEVPKPERIEEGVFWIPRYKFTGWILERWFPATAWGTQHDWEAQIDGADGRTRMMQAEWPRHGDYFMIPGAGPWQTIEAAGDLKAAIRAYIQAEREKPVDWDAYLKGELALEMSEREQLATEYENRMAQVSRSAVSPVLGSMSHAAQRVRNQIAREIGGDDWHLGAF